MKNKELRPKLAARQAALCGILVAVGFALSYLEAILPPLPVAGLKLGLANCVLLLALYSLGWKQAALVMLGRVLLSTLLLSGLSALPFSLMGGVLSLAVMALLYKRRALSPYGVSAAGAAAHHIGQVLAAVVVLKSTTVLAMLVYLLPLSIPTGLLMAWVFRRLPAWKNSLHSPQ